MNCLHRLRQSLCVRDMAFSPILILIFMPQTSLNCRECLTAVRISGKETVRDHHWVVCMKCLFQKNFCFLSEQDGSISAGYWARLRQLWLSCPTTAPKTGDLSLQLMAGFRLY